MVERQSGLLRQLEARDFSRVRLHKINLKYQKNLQNRNLTSDKIKTIDPKLGIPLLEAASLETDDFLQNTWARLLTNAVDPNFKSEIRVAFVDIIKTLTAVDVKILEEIHSSLSQEEKLNSTSIEVHINSPKILNSLKVDMVTYEASLNNLERCQLISYPDPMWGNVDENGNIIRIFTAFGMLFVRACVDKNPQP